MKMAQTYSCAHDQPRKPITETVTCYYNDIINLLGYEYVNINNLKKSVFVQNSYRKECIIILVL